MGDVKNSDVLSIGVEGWVCNVVVVNNFDDDSAWICNCVDELVTYQVVCALVFVVALVVELDVCAHVFIVVGFVYFGTC